MIAQVAIEEDLLIVHSDRDVDFLASVAPEVRQYVGGLTGSVVDTIHEPVDPYDGK